MAWFNAVNLKSSLQSRNNIVEFLVSGPAVDLKLGREAMTAEASHELLATRLPKTTCPLPVPQASCVPSLQGRKRYQRLGSGLKEYLLFRWNMMKSEYVDKRCDFFREKRSWTVALHRCCWVVTRCTTRSKRLTPRLASLCLGGVTQHQASWKCDALDQGISGAEGHTVGPTGSVTKLQGLGASSNSTMVHWRCLWMLQPEGSSTSNWQNWTKMLNPALYKARSTSERCWNRRG